MEIRPILSAMMHNKTGAILIAMQIALTLALVVNALFITTTRIEKIQRPLGVDVENIFSLNMSLVGNVDNPGDQVRIDMTEIRAIPGVLDATPIYTYLQSGSARITDYRSVVEPNDDYAKIVNTNSADEHGLAAMGVSLLAGRNFRADEIKYVAPSDPDHADVVIITESLGRQFFPNGDIVGKTIYTDEDAKPSRIVGVINDVATGWVAREEDFFQNTEYNFMLRPIVTYGSSINYLVRTEPGQLDRVIPQVEEKLVSLNSDRLIERVRSQVEVTELSYQNDWAMMKILSVVMILMVTITGLGVVGLASFSVNQRTRQIGTRRALGAKKKHILRYFLVENLLLTTMGVLFGGFLTYLVNYLLYTWFALPQLDPAYLPIGVFLLYLLGLVAVWGPALKAASIPPAIATRSV